jgi:hypothetical protein
LTQINPIHTVPSYLCKIHFNIMHPLTSWSSYWSLFFWLSQQSPIFIPTLPRVCYIPCPSHPLSLHYPSYIWRRVQVMKLIMQFSPASYYFILIRPDILLDTLFSNIFNLRSPP